MIDGENDPVAVAAYFARIGATNHCFGNGISVLNDILGPNVRPSMERACELRAQGDLPHFIYCWTVNDDELQREYIRIGVDGIISDDVPALRGKLAEPEFQNLIRLAERSDNPFMAANAAYGLIIYTGDVFQGGTDANVTFTLHGTDGSAAITVDTNYARRQERGDVNYVTVQGPDLGELQSMTVQRDDAGSGPDWYLDRIEVFSSRYGTMKQAAFGGWIDNTSPYQLTLS